MGKTNKKKYYAVRNGRNIGIFTDWATCEKSVKGFSGNEYKSFNTLVEAKLYLDQNKNKSEKIYYNHFKSINSKYYAVRNGRNIGIFNDWATCEKSVNNFAGCEYKSFNTLAEAKLYLDQNKNEVNNENKSRKSNIYHSHIKSINSKAIKKKKIKKKKIIQISENISDINIIDGFLRHTDSRFVCYVDGGADKKQRAAGYGVYFGPSLSISEATPVDETTNQYAEIHATLRALQEAISLDIQHLLIRTDSMFVVNSVGNGAKSWIHKWKSGNNMWKTVTNKPVIHKKLWLKYMELRKQLKTVDFEHVRAHCGEKYNEIADKLATQGKRKYVEKYHSKH